MRRVRDHFKPRVGRLAGDASGMSSVSRSPTMTSTGIVSADNGRGSGQAGRHHSRCPARRARRGLAVAWARDLHTARRLERDATAERVAHQDRWQPLANQFDERGPASAPDAAKLGAAVITSAAITTCSLVTV
jgi:hypothetical protein